MKNIAVLGLGFVGLPLSLTYAMYGEKVYGIDINSKYVENLKKYKTHIVEYYKGKTIEEILENTIKKGLFVPTASISEGLKNADKIIVTVGIPIKNGVLQNEIFNAAIKSVGKNLKKGDLVLIRSTVPPGTTREVALPILEKESKLKCSKDFYLAYSSERIAEGKAFEEFQTMPVAVAGVDEKSTNKAYKLLRMINKEDIIVATEPEVVEMAKLIENSSRDVNIALANELASLAEKMDIDTLEVINVANTHKRVHLLKPGIGVGGHCIPYSSLYLFDKTDKMKLPMEILHTAREVNQQRPRNILNYLESALKKAGKEVEHSKFAILGVAMKDNSPDISESPAMRLKELILQSGGEVNWFDPNVTGDFPLKRNSIQETVKDADVIILPINQDNFKIEPNTWKSLTKKNAIIFDARRLIDKEKAKKLGFIYMRI